ncbi:uncharacterized protein LOC130665911 [Microplitis mediator]|uniref:uncharacterized protein LOC130665911 n=1 Tax=Microplitis mediator TaxID=375433 RepID=UPI002552F237|nr:uncharacterized protein LOC130665911 [Microplitis mediator]
MTEFLNIQKPIIFDESISRYKVHSHRPYASTSFNNSDEIRMSIQHQDLCILPSKSTLHICGRFTNEDGSAVNEAMELVYMAICHMFEEIRYELNAIEINRCKNVGMTSLIKNNLYLTPGQGNLMENARCLQTDDKLTNSDGYFDISIPLSLLFGFAEDYNRIIMNA